MLFVVWAIVFLDTCWLWSKTRKRLVGWCDLCDVWNHSWTLIFWIQAQRPMGGKDRKLHMDELSRKITKILEIRNDIILSLTCYYSQSEPNRKSLPVVWCDIFTVWSKHVEIPIVGCNIDLVYPFTWTGMLMFQIGRPKCVSGPRHTLKWY